MEVIISIIVQLIAIGVFIGVYKTTIDFMQRQIEDLKSDMHKYNNVLERLAKAEQSTKSAHKRIDKIEEIR